MNLTKRSKILISVVGVIAILGVVGQATGVLAAWNDKVWGKASFTRAANLEGYARSTTAHAYTNRAITSGEFTATNALHTQANPGTTQVPSATGWTHASSSGVLLLGTVSADGRSSATYTMNGSVVTANAASNARNIELFPTGFASVLNTDNSQYSASVSCSSGNWGGAVSTTAVAPAGGSFRVGLTTYTVPSANQTTTIDSLAAGFRVQGTLKSTVTTTAKRALSTLILDVDIKTAITQTTVWTVTVQFVRAECGIGEPLPSAGVQSAAAARLARLAPSSSSTEPSESAASSSADSSESATPGSESASSESKSSSAARSESESASSASSSESEAADTPVAGQGPTPPTDVDVGDRFPVIATDGTDLGAATIQKIESTAPSEGAKATVAVKMSVTTSDTGGDGRLSSVAWDDFAPIVGGVPQASGRATAEGPPLPAQLEPGQTYTGWVTFTAPSAAGSAIWKAPGTAGFTFVLPEPEVPVTSTTSKPAPVVKAPETSAPETSEPAADAPEADASEPEDSDPVPMPEKKQSRSSSDDSSESSSASSDEE
ncbi:hypothetical protein RD149_02510 [Gordonia westfalica]|uniref:SipW-cognate class signal peptide n=1 Tax=Gordonia westfalica TaxID=158898 RepID=A0ABU2GMF5_9ACTN|nr:hypothetical protein [Gordonia westfalica]MDS1112633.1 hypothetical protein [Gordonia westfalica]